METPSRDDLERLVSGIEFPISKRALLEAARQSGVSAELLVAIEICLSPSSATWGERYAQAGDP